MAQANMNHLLNKQQAMLAGGGTFVKKAMMTPIKELDYEGSTMTGDDDCISHMPDDSDMSNAYAACYTPIWPPGTSPMSNPFSGGGTPGFSPTAPPGYMFTGEPYNPYNQPGG